MSALPSTSPPEMLIGMIATPLAWEYWPAARAMLSPALARSDEEWPEVERDLAAEDNQLWAVLEDGILTASAVTRIAKTSRGEVVEVYLVGGDGYTRWLAPLNAQIEDAARGIGCIAMRAYGREGWRKALGALGWNVRTIAYEKALS